jgi:glycerophosphoryl diester phosphodiesterase
MKNLSCFALALFFLYAIPMCKADTAIIAHRGASRDAPDNTLAAFKLAWEQGADGIEGDFHMTKDGRIVCLHDGSIGHAGKKMSISRSTLSQIREIDVGSRHGEKWAGERIPTIEEVFATIPEGKRIFVEVKCGPEIIPALKRSIEQSKLKSDQVVVISFSSKVIARSKESMPELKALWLNSGKGGKEKILRTLRDIKADGADIKASKLIDSAFVAAFRKADKEIHVWTVNKKDAALRFQQLGVDTITTDVPGLMRNWLQKPQEEERDGNR